MSRRVKKTWIVENTWVCSSCGHKNKGRHMKCQQCGSPKEKHEKYDTSGNLTAPEVTDSEMLRQAKAGKNWECTYCGGSVRNLFDECATCGGPKTEAAREQAEDGILCSVCCMPGCSGVCEVAQESHKEDFFRSERTPVPEPEPVVEREFVPNTGGLRSAPEYKVIPPSPKKGIYDGGGDDGDGGWRKKMRRRNWRPILIGLAITALFAALIGFFVWLFVPHEENVAIQDTSWTYIAHLQQRETRHGSGWDETVPSGAFNESCHTRQRGTENCNPHDCNPHSESYDCRPHDCNCRQSCSDNGNGYSTCSESCSTCYDTCSRTVYDTCYDQCPVYDQWCDYDYYAWPTIRTERLSGSDHDMREPVLTTQPNPPSPQRVVREHHFSVTFCNDEDTWTYSPNSANDYNRFDRGDAWVIEVNRAGSVNPLHLDTTE